MGMEVKTALDKFYEVFDNAEISTMIKALGAGIQDNMDLSKLILFLLRLTYWQFLLQQY